MKKVFDHMSYLPDMEQIDSPVMDEVLSAVRAYDYNQYTEQDVRAALRQRVIDPAAFGVLLSPAAQPFLEDLAGGGIGRDVRHCAARVGRRHAVHAAPASDEEDVPRVLLWRQPPGAAHRAPQVSEHGLQRGDGGARS